MGLSRNNFPRAFCGGFFSSFSAFFSTEEANSKDPHKVLGLSAPEWNPFHQSNLASIRSKYSACGKKILQNGTVKYLGQMTNNVSQYLQNCICHSMPCLSQGPNFWKHQCKSEKQVDCWCLATL